MRHFHPTAERTKEPICAALRALLPRKGVVLELASGSGQHIVHFADQMPNLSWQPSEISSASLASIRSWISYAGSKNVRVPMRLDASAKFPDTVGDVDAVLVINLFHIVPNTVMDSVFSNASALLQKGGGPLCIYGPFLASGAVQASPVLEASTVPGWGVQEVVLPIDHVVKLAAMHGLVMQDNREMPQKSHRLVTFRLE